MRYSFLTRAFADSFVGRFNADVVDLDDPDHIRAQARGCAASLAVKKDVDLNSLIKDLREFLGTWDRETLLVLTEWTNLEWTDSPAMEAHLRHIIEELIKALEEIIQRPKVY